MSGADHLVAILTEYCEKPPVVNTTESHRTISCFWVPSEIDFEHELGFSCKIEKRGGSDVITAVDFSTSSKMPKVVDFMAKLHERVSLPFYIMSADHARLFIKRTIWLDMEEEGWVEPPAWSCPFIMKDGRSGSVASFAIASSDSASEFCDQRYAKFIEWLDVPPAFPGSLTRGNHPPFSSHISVKVFLNDLKDVNRSNDMRCYFDEGDMTNCILKASPHLIFHVFDKGANAEPKKLCSSLDTMGVLGLEYHLRFPADYPHSAPLVRCYRPQLSGGFVLPSGAVCTDALQPAAWLAKQSFEAVFRSILYLQGFHGLVATVDRVYADEAEAHKTTFEWLAKVHSEWQSGPGAKK